MNKRVMQITTSVLIASSLYSTTIPTAVKAKSLHNASTYAPKTVVILIMGLGSSLPGKTPILLNGDEYWNSQDYQTLSKYFSPFPLSKSTNYPIDKQLTTYLGPTLIDKIHSINAIVIPYSYNPTPNNMELSENNGDVHLTIQPYTSADISTTMTNPNGLEEIILNHEVNEINKMWPHTHIVIVGHSNGGLVASQYFLHGWNPGSNVTAIYSLDGPLNGVKQDLLTDIFGLLSNVPNGIITPQLISLYQERWNDIDGTNPTFNELMSEKISKYGIFHAVGTVGDQLYQKANATTLNEIPEAVSKPVYYWKISDISNDNDGMISQLILNRKEINEENYTVPPVPVENSLVGYYRIGKTFYFPSHMFVMRDQDTINNIVNSILTAEGKNISKLKIPTISSTSLNMNSNYPVITVKGNGFGKLTESLSKSTDYTYMSAIDLTGNWSMGIGLMTADLDNAPSSLPPSKVTTKVLKWTNTEIQFEPSGKYGDWTDNQGEYAPSGSTTSKQTVQWWFKKGDTVLISVINPQTSLYTNGIVTVQ